MNASWRFPLIIGLSMILGGPVLSDMAMGSTADLTTAGLRYLAALGLSWFGVSTIFRMLDRYRYENELALHIATLEAAQEAAAVETEQAGGAHRDEADRESISA